MEATNKVVSPTTEWCVKAKFKTIVSTIRQFEDQCAVLLQLVRHTSRLAKVKGAAPCYCTFPR